MELSGLETEAPQDTLSIEWGPRGSLASASVERDLPRESLNPVRDTEAADEPDECATLDRPHIRRGNPDARPPPPPRESSGGCSAFGRERARGGGGAARRGCVATLAYATIAAVGAYELAAGLDIARFTASRRDYGALAAGAALAGAGAVGVVAHWPCGAAARGARARRRRRAVRASAGLLAGALVVASACALADGVAAALLLRDVDACAGADDDGACAGDDWGPESAGGACRARWCAHRAGVDCACAGVTAEGEPRCISCVTGQHALWRRARSREIGVSTRPPPLRSRYDGVRDCSAIQDEHAGALARSSAACALGLVLGLFVLLGVCWPNVDYMCGSGKGRECCAT